MNKAPELKSEERQDTMVFFSAVESEGTQAAVIADYNYIPDYETTYQGEEKKFNALEIFFIIPNEDHSAVSFLKTWPKSYSLNERAWFHKLYKAAMGRQPAAGDTVEDILGKAVLINVSNKHKQRKDGSAYVASNLDGDPTAIPKGMKVPKMSVKAAAESVAKEMARLEETRNNSKTNTSKDEDVPY